MPTMASDVRTYGWWLVGPMKPVCLDDAPTEADALALPEVLQAWPLTQSLLARMTEPECVVCGRRLDEDM